MNDTRKLRHEVWKDLAGSLYDELVQSEERAMAHLFDADRNLRIAAIDICHSVWNCSANVGFLNACQDVAAADPDDSVRTHALEIFGAALESSQDPSACQFLADLAKDGTNPEEVRRAAYWALREVQLGLTEEDNIKRLASAMKLALRRAPMGMAEQEVKRAVLCNGYFPEAVWDCADEIDWDFVDRYASHEEA